PWIRIRNRLYHWGYYTKQAIMELWPCPIEEQALERIYGRKFEGRADTVFKFGDEQLLLVFRHALHIGNQCRTRNKIKEFIRSIRNDGIYLFDDLYLLQATVEHELGVVVHAQHRR